MGFSMSGALFPRETSTQNSQTVRPAFDFPADQPQQPPATYPALPLFGLVTDNPTGSAPDDPVAAGAGGAIQILGGSTYDPIVYAGQALGGATYDPIAFAGHTLGGATFEPGAFTGRGLAFSAGQTGTPASQSIVTISLSGAATAVQDLVFRGLVRIVGRTAETQWGGTERASAGWAAMAEQVLGALNTAGKLSDERVQLSRDIVAKLKLWGAPEPLKVGDEADGDFTLMWQVGALRASLVVSDDEVLGYAFGPKMHDPWVFEGDRIDTSGLSQLANILGAEGCLLTG
jgi:hypothetical protein